MRLTLVAALIALAASAPAAAAEPGANLPAGCPDLAKRERLYRVCEDQGAILSAAGAEARQSGKLVLAVFGATWCPSCKALHRQMPDILAAPLAGGGPDTVGSAFVPVEIATSTLVGGRREVVGSGQAALDALLAKAPGFKVRGVPFVVVVEAAEHQPVVARNLDDLEGPQGFDTRRLAGFLAAARAHLREGAPAPSEPGWIERKLRRWLGRS